MELPDINVELCVGLWEVWVQRAVPSRWIDEEAQDGGGAGEADALLSAECGGACGAAQRPAPRR